MKAMIDIRINEKGEHWYKEVRVLGLMIYRRSNFTHKNNRKPVGFTIHPAEPIHIESDHIDDE